MPYKLIFKYDNGTSAEMSPLQNDSPTNKLGINCPSIKRKGDMWAAKLTNRFDDLSCKCLEYND